MFPEASPGTSILGSQDAQEAHKTASARPRRARDGLKIAEEGPKRAFKRQKSAHSLRKTYVFSILAGFVFGVPQTSPRSPNTAQERPKRAQDGPKRSSCGAQGTPQDGPRSAKAGPGGGPRGP
eukprot:8713601-Pyramimonas_sp.AAC.1